MFDDAGDAAPLEMSAVSVSVAPVTSLLASWERRIAGDHRRTFAWIFAASVLVHTSIALRLQSATARPPARSLLSQVDIEIARPPPPPPPVVVPDPPRPPEPKLLKPTVPQAVARQPERVTEPVSAVESTLPSSNDGILPPAPQGTAAPVAEPVVAAPPPPPPPPPPVIEAKEGANYLKNPRPPYPHLAQREGWQGLAVLRVRVLADGRPAGATVQKSAGHGVLDDAAIEAVKGWTFVPATQGGQPIAGWVTVPIDFRLQ
jgi:periplasmic protein TonB